MNPKVDAFLEDGCGRCSNYKTPQCSVIIWNDIVKELRLVALESGLDESFKWSQPVYTWKNKNIAIVSAFKKYAFISFFNGALLQDDAKILEAPGKHSQADQQIRLTSVEEFEKREPLLKAISLKLLRMKNQVEKLNSRMKLNHIQMSL